MNYPKLSKPSVGFVKCLQRVCVLTALMAASALSADTPPMKLSFASGHVEVSPEGLVSIINADGTCQANLSVDYYAPGWKRTSQEDVKPIQLATEEPDTWSWTGTYRQGDLSMSFEQTVWDKGDKVEVEYRLERPEGFEVEAQSRGPFVSVEFPGDCFDDRNIMIGTRTVTLPISNIWGNGNKVVIPGLSTELTLSDWTVISVWNSRGRREARLQTLTQDGKMPGPKSYVLRVTIDKQVTEVSEEPVEKVLSIKLRSYPRILNLATTAGVDTALPKIWLSEAAVAFDQKDESEAKYLVNKFEDWMDAQGRVYDVHDRITHLDVFNRVLDGAETGALSDRLEQAVHALNQGEAEVSMTHTEVLREQLDVIEQRIRNTYGFSYYPARDYNPYAWVKAFTSQGYVCAADHLTPGEPCPDAVGWPSGGRGTGDFFMSLLPEDAPDLQTFDVDRTWVRNTWKSPDGPEYTFSVLTPLMAVDGVTHLPLSALPSAPEVVTWPVGGDTPASVDFDDVKEARVVPESMQAGWIWLRGSRFSMLLFPTVPVAGIQREGNDVSIELTEAGSVSLLMVPNYWNTAKVMEEAPFWAGVAAKSPSDVVETFDGGAVTHRYLYTERPTFWQTNPQTIAPVPPLTVMHRKDGDWLRSELPNEAGDFRYVAGDRLTVSLPPLKQPLRRGINEYLARLSDDRVAEFADMGVDWVRVAFGRKDWRGRPEEAYAMLDTVLQRLRAQGMKALIDPHDFEFAVHDWNKGIPEDPEERQVFLDLWQRIAEVSQDYPDVVVGYDLYNELKVRNDYWHTWDKLAKEAIDVIRKIDTRTPIYISGIDMSNPSGYINASPIDRENLVYSYHFYAPHSFSHQKIFRASTNDAFVFYPGWIPQIDWKNDEIYGAADLQWWDRWTLMASMWPVLEFAARHDVAFHCGEVAPIGYSRKKASDGAGLWTCDALDTIEQYGFAWHLWNQGFGLVIEPVADEAMSRWADDSKLPEDER